MANPRPDEKVTQASQETIQKVADAGTRTARTTADTSERAARAGAEVLARNAETVQQAWESGSDIASRLTERSADQMARALGISGEEAQRAAQLSSRNIAAIVQSGTVIAEGVQSISREWFEFTRERMEGTVGRLEALMRCRTPQELAVIQSDAVRENLEGFLQSTRRIAELSVRMADEAVRKITDNIEQTSRAA
jgi:phasin family protein